MKNEKHFALNLSALSCNVSIQTIIYIFFLVCVCFVICVWNQKGGFYHQPERQQHLQPIAGGCERCRQQHSILSNTLSWAAPGLSQIWGTPSKLKAIHQRSFRGPFHPNDELF